MKKEVKNARVGDFDRILGQKIRDFRNSLNLSQEDIGNAIGVTFQQVQKYEQGLNRIHSESLWKLSLNFGVDISFFFPENEGYEEGNQSSAFFAAERYQNGGSEEEVNLIKNYMLIDDQMARKKILSLMESISKMNQK